VAVAVEAQWALQLSAAVVVARSAAVEERPAVARDSRLPRATPECHRAAPRAPARPQAGQHPGPRRHPKPALLPHRHPDPARLRQGTPVQALSQAAAVTTDKTPKAGNDQTKPSPGFLPRLGLEEAGKMPAGFSESSAALAAAISCRRSWSARQEGRTAKTPKNAKRASNAPPACADVSRTPAEHSSDSRSLAVFGVLGVPWRFHSH